MLGEGDYDAFGSILPLRCLAAAAEERLDLLSVNLPSYGVVITHTL